MRNQYRSASGKRIYKSSELWHYIGLFLILSWCVNLYKFSCLDFKENYKAEAIRGAVIFIWPASAVVAWIDIGEESQEN